MMLIMTYNGYVIIDVILGLTIGYTIFGFEVDKDKNIPVNCCAWFGCIGILYFFLFKNFGICYS